MNYALLLAAFLGITSVFLGAYGDHHLLAQLDSANWKSWSTALHYHQLYAVVILVFALFRWLSNDEILRMYSTAIISFFTASIVLFSGSIYFRILTGFTEISWITPIGGLLLMSSWLMVIIFACFYKKES